MGMYRYIGYIGYNGYIRYIGCIGFIGYIGLRGLGYPECNPYIIVQFMYNPHVNPEKLPCRTLPTLLFPRWSNLYSTGTCIAAGTPL